MWCWHVFERTICQSSNSQSTCHLSAISCSLVNTLIHGSILKICISCSTTHGSTINVLRRFTRAVRRYLSGCLFGLFDAWVLEPILLRLCYEFLGIDPSGLSRSVLGQISSTFCDVNKFITCGHNIVASMNHRCKNKAICEWIHLVVICKNCGFKIAANNCLEDMFRIRAKDRLSSLLEPGKPAI